MTPEPSVPRGRIHVLHTLPDLAVGGGQRLVLDLVRNLDPARFAVTIVTFSPDGGMCGAFEAAGFPPLVLRHGGRARQVASIASLARILVRRRVDIIHSHGGVDSRYAAVAAALTRRPLVRHVHGLGRRRPGSQMPQRVTRFGRLLLLARSRLVRRSFVAVSEVTYEDRMVAASVAGEKVHLVANGVDVERFSRPMAPEDARKLRAELGIHDRSPVLADVAALRPKKGHHELLVVLATVRDRWPDAVLLVVGEGPLRGELEAAARERGLADAVRLLGERDDVESVLSISDVFVFPSHSEGFGLAPLEAMASGTPVVAYRLPALEAFIAAGDSGVLTPLGEPDKLAAGVLSLLDDPPLAHLIAEAGRAVAVRHGIDRSARALERVYEEVVAGPPRRNGYSRG